MHFLLKGNPVVAALAMTTLAAYLLLTLFIASEPTVANGQASANDDIVVTQEIVGEISITIASTTMQMDGTIAGLTGGSSRATTTVNVKANNATGYNLTIQFASTTAMLQDGGAGYIDNYNTGDANGDYDMSVGAGESAFAYSISGISTDIVTAFKNDGGSCGVGANSTLGKCWYNQSDAENTVNLINRSTSTPSGGATSTINFQVQVGSGSSLETGFYTATSTLTATEN